MKNKYIWAKLGFCGLAFHLAVGGQMAWADDAAPKTDAEKLSYAFGLNIGTSLKPMKRMGVDLDVDQMIKGLKDALSGDTPLLNSNEVAMIMTAFQAEQPAKCLKAGQDFLEKNKSQPGVKVLDDGLQYKVLKEGSGPKPNLTDTVNVNYRGTFIDGDQFDASPEGKPVQCPLTSVIRGWTEILQLMPTGSKWQVYIPADLAYGAKGAHLVPPYSALVFDIELLSIAPPAAPAPAGPLAPATPASPDMTKGIPMARP